MRFYRSSERLLPRCVSARSAKPLFAVMTLLLASTGHATAGQEAALQSALARNTEGLELLREGDPGKAAEKFRNALKLDPTFADAHLNLGSVLLQSGSTDAAIGEFQAAIRLQPRAAEAHLNLGKALRRTEAWAGAVREH